MGITVFGLGYLLSQKQRHPELFKGHILQLGRQDIYFVNNTFEEMAKTFDVTLTKQENLDIRTHIWMKEGEVISDLHLFRSLGFRDVSSLDFVADEGANIVHDLNLPVDPNLHLKFDFIYDGGTMEHVFDVAAVFKNIHNMLSCGGVIYHETPTNNYVDHGFWMASPTLFVDTAAANGYEIVDTMVFEGSVSQYYEGPYVESPYNPVAFRDLDIGGHGDGVMTTFHLARKPAEHRAWVNPIQGYYREHWQLPG